MGDIQIHYVPDICFSVFILQKQWGNRKSGSASIFMQYLAVEIFGAFFPRLIPDSSLKKYPVLY